MRPASGLRVTREAQPTRPVRRHSVPTDAQAATDGYAQTRKRTQREASPSPSSGSAPAHEDAPTRGRNATLEEVAHERARSAHLEQETEGYARRVGASPSVVASASIGTLCLRTGRVGCASRVTRRPLAGRIRAYPPSGGGPEAAAVLEDGVLGVVLLCELFPGAPSKTGVLDAASRAASALVGAV